MRPYLKKKKKTQKRAGGIAQSVGLEFKPQKIKIKKHKDSGGSKCKSRLGKKLGGSHLNQ
jgi:hypothetical protein